MVKQLNYTFFWCMIKEYFVLRKGSNLVKGNWMSSIVYGCQYGFLQVDEVSVVLIINHMWLWVTLERFNTLNLSNAFFPMVRPFLMIPILLKLINSKPNAYLIDIYTFKIHCKPVACFLSSLYSALHTFEFEK